MEDGGWKRATHSSANSSSILSSSAAFMAGPTVRRLTPAGIPVVPLHFDAVPVRVVGEEAVHAGDLVARVPFHRVTGALDGLCGGVHVAHPQREMARAVRVALSA